MTRERKWSEMFPEGRHIYYEGDDPSGFVKEMKARFDFDPSLDNKWWGYGMCHNGGTFLSYSFFCPPEILDAIYGDGRYPLGS